MKPIRRDLSQLSDSFPDSFTREQKAAAQTVFLKRLSLVAHRRYQGKIQILPKVPVYGPNWFGAWYTPGISKISTTIRDDSDQSLDLTWRGNTVAVVSDSTRVLGDGDCTPQGGMGVMEGKAFLMKYLGGIDAVPVCIDSRQGSGENDPRKIIEFVKMVQHSFGAINLEDISQPNCFQVLDELRESCQIPVWHDDAQGTACVTLAGVLNALKLAGKRIGEIRIVLLGAGAAMTSIARLLIADGADPEKIAMFDVRGGLHRDRSDLEADPRFYRAWELCRKTNPGKIGGVSAAFPGADLLVAASAPGPGTVKPEWIRSMAPRSVVFACANPVPEIYPHAAREAGAFIVGTGRGDFPNQVNNSICFPGILKGALLVRARQITDAMAIRAAHSIADYAESQGIHPERILPAMDDAAMVARQAADVAEQAAADGVARIPVDREEVQRIAGQDIARAQALFQMTMDNGLIEEFPQHLLEAVLAEAVREVSAS